MAFLTTKKKSLLLILLISGILLSACSTVSYYTQSIVGHTAIMLSRQPIEDVLQTADDPLKQKLLVAIEARDFAIQNLALPDNGSYTTFVKLKDDTVVWNVIAAEAFSLKAKQWCYPVVGCASYRGYYDKKNAEKYADELRQQGFDVHIAGATAYSTLGWFADPLTSAMLKQGDASTAELIFHELSHQQLYIKGDSRFNEAFASAVGEQGAMRWMQQTQRDEMLNEYLQRLTVRDDFIALVEKTKKELEELYSSDKIDSEKLSAKETIFDNMRKAHEQLIAEKWGGKKWYTRWFSQPINNARLVAIATYRDLVPDFVNLFEACESDFPRFYKKVEQVSETEARNLQVACD